jgi:ABC-type lipoprotein export system ATPase subunit
MGNLILDSLEIQGFRGFRHLQIEKLGRVNLIVGKNNVGKSSLLEALQLYARRGYPTLIWEFLRSRDESKLTSPGSVVEPEELLLLSLRYMFYGRNDVGVLTKPIQIGAMNLPDSTLSIFVRWYTTEKDEEGFVRRRLLQPEEYDASDNSSPGFLIQLGSQFTVHHGLNPNRLANQLIPELKEINSVYAKTNLLSKTRIGVLWDNIALTGLDKEVLDALRIVAPGVEGLTLVDDTDYPRKERSRIPVVKIASIDERLPLGHLGDGMQRMLSITLALVNSKNGLLLVDEIENGLHYQIQPDLWRFIFRLAHRLNIQVFATTHSWDCIQAFQKVSQENKHIEGILIRLEDKNGEIGATLFDERRLNIATDEEIEIR